MKTFQNYLKEFKTLNSSAAPKVKPAEHVALLSSFNIKGLAEILSVKCHEESIACCVYTGEYAQYQQEILDTKSGLYTSKADTIFLLVDSQGILGDYVFDAYDYTASERRELIESKFQEFSQLIDLLQERSSGRCVITTLDIPLFSPMDIIDNKHTFGLHESIRKFNSMLEERYCASTNVFIYDFNRLITKLGHSAVFDPRLYYVGDIKFSFNALVDIAEDFTAYLRAFTGKTRKCLVLDLDNTLWGGVLGEDGINGIKLGPTPEGRVFWEMQKYILSLFKRGIILAVNSKNNEADVMEVFASHPYMILKPEHFASMRINWEDKVTNMRELANEINIGLDSLVFVDDDKFNCEMVMDALPQVKVINLPEDPAYNLTVIQNIRDFSAYKMTSEDMSRGAMYADNRQRNILEKISLDVEQYLAALKMKATICPPTSFMISRISQLTQKTNQWNMTSRRYSEKDIQNMAAGSNYYIRAIQVEDKFGDNGVIAVMIAQKQKEEWMIDTCLMSCRVIGRRIEEVLIGDVILSAKSEGALRVTGEFIPTPKNKPSEDVYKNLGFAFKEGRWIYETNNEFVLPEFIIIERKTDE